MEWMSEKSFKLNNIDYYTLTLNIAQIRLNLY